MVEKVPLLKIWLFCKTYLGANDGSIIIGWHLSVVGQIYEQTMWNQDMLNRFGKRY